MMTAGFFLRVSLSALLLVAASGFPAKGSKSTQQSSGGSSGPSSTFASHLGGSRGRYTPVSYGPSVSMPVVVQSPGPQLVQAAPALSGLSSTVPVGYPGSSGSVVSVPAAYVASGPAVPVQGAYVASGPAVPVQGAYVASGPAVSVQGAYVSPTQLGADPSGLREAKWTLDPQLVPAGGSADSQAFGSGDFLPPPPPVQSEPVLQSGQTSNVVKEAELGNYQQQTEEFGYPDDRPVYGSGSSSLVVPASGLGGYWGSPYPGFDYNLLHGSYPVGTYSKFSQHHEKGKDYHQSIHYLKEHDDGGQGPVQQKKVFQGSS